jgi:tRNA (guanine37-N1)-methyltransferase
VRIDIVTIFPEFFDSPLRESIVRRAREKGLLDIRVHDLRDYTTDRHRVTDDYPYGGGAGMVMKPEPIFAAVEAVQSEGPPRRVSLLSPKGRTWTHELAREYSSLPGIVLVCGRYEGEDERVRLSLVDDEISIGDYVLAGGETAALVILESVARLVPEVVGDAESVEQDSFYAGILDYPQYTRPPVFREMEVPPVLLSGNHADIRRWRRKEALRLTLERRPDLLEKAPLSRLDEELLQEVRREGEGS